jgi:pantothenate synthetase
MLIIKDIPNLHLYLKAYKEKGYATGYVPTMGALHDGHGSLIDKSHNDNQKTIVSIFVNEKQFNDAQILSRIPETKVMITIFVKIIKLTLFLSQALKKSIRKIINPS